MTGPDPEQALEYLDGFVRKALSCLRPGEAKGAWWEFGRCWVSALVDHPHVAGCIRHAPDGEPYWVANSLHGIPVKFVDGDQISLMLAPTRNPYDRPPGAVDEAMGLTDIPLAIAYNGKAGDGKTSQVRCIVVTPRGIENSPVDAILPQARLLLPGGPGVKEAGRIFAGQYFKLDLTAALRALDPDPYEENFKGFA